MLLHGDLHHGNILASRREPWLAIDPTGVVGEPAFDPASLLYNPAALLAAPHPGCVDQLAQERPASGCYDEPTNEEPTEG